MVSCFSHCKFHGCYMFCLYCMIMVCKWYSTRNTVTINTSVSKVAKQLIEDISLLISIREGDTLDINESENECTIKIGMIQHKLLIEIIHEVIIMLAIVLAV